MQHPFLQEDFHIHWAKLTPEHIEPDITKALSDARTAIATIAARKSDPVETLTYENTIDELDQATEPLTRAWGLVSHLDSVCNSKELREAHNAMLPQVTEFFSSIPLDEALWETLRKFGESPAVQNLSPTKQRYASETLADFREQGADLPKEKKAHAAELRKRLAQLTQKYAENCLDASNAWEKILTDESELSGLPTSAIAAARHNAQQKGLKDAWRFRKNTTSSGTCAVAMG